MPGAGPEERATPPPFPLPIAGLGPHGERAAAPASVALSAAESARARAAAFTVAVVLHTTESDWARQHLAGIAATLGRHGAAMVEVIDCRFAVEAQIRALRRLAAQRPDAIISLPVANQAVAAAHREASAASRLVLVDNGPSGLAPGRDYAAVVSADNFALGEIGARLLAPHVPRGRKVGIVSYRVEFFVSAQREIAFRKQIAALLPDSAIVTAPFADMAEVGAVTRRLLRAHPDLGGLFVVWDTPALAALAALRAEGRALPLTTIDLGREIATALAAGDCVKGIGAQHPFEQGVAVANAAIAALLGRELPPWIVQPALAVTRETVIPAYQAIWHAPAPAELIARARA